MLARPRIGNKLLLAPAMAALELPVLLLLLLLLLLAASGNAYWALVQQHQRLDAVVQTRAQRVGEVSRLASELQAAHALNYQLVAEIRSGMPEHHRHTVAAMVRARQRAIAYAFERLQTLRPAPERPLVAQGAAAYASYMQATQHLLETAQREQGPAADFMAEAQRRADQVAARLRQLVRHEQAMADAAARSAAGDEVRMTLLIPLLATLSLVLALGIGMALRRLLRTEAGQSAAGQINRMLDLPDACAVVEQRQLNCPPAHLTGEAAALAAALQEHGASLSQAVAGISGADGAATPVLPVAATASPRARLHLASKRE